MNRKKIFLGLIIVVIALTPLLSVQANEKGYWAYYTYTKTIPVGEGWHHECNHQGAQNAYAVVTKSTGECTLVYEWDSPLLEVWIANDDTTSITVTWREYFYEN